MKLKKSDIYALKWANENAEDWRGSLVGNPDPEPLEYFDLMVCAAKKALRKVKKAKRTAQKPVLVPPNLLN